MKKSLQVLFLLLFATLLAGAASAAGGVMSGSGTAAGVWGEIGLNNTRIITVSAPSADLFLVVEPLFIAEGNDFAEARVTVSTSGSDPVNVDIFVKLVDAVAPQSVPGRADEEWSGQSTPFEQDLTAWLDAPGNSKQALTQGNYSLSAVVKKVGSDEVLAEDSLIFTVGPARRVPVPELNVLLLPLLLAIVLFVLWKKR